jgi:hypothetical protein
MNGSGACLRLAARDLYANSWRLVPLNALFGAILVAVVVVAIPVPVLGVLVVLAGPVAAALAHCAVTLARTGNLALGDAVAGLRAHWRRGLLLAALGSAFVLLAVLAIRFYSGSSLAWPLAFVVFYLGICLGVFQAVLWVLAIAEPGRPLRAAAARALETIVRRPGATAALGLALLAVNVLGLAVAVMPFLTLTVAYSFVAVAHFALPRPTQEEPA